MVLISAYGLWHLPLGHKVASIITMAQLQVPLQVGVLAIATTVKLLLVVGESLNLRNGPLTMILYCFPSRTRCTGNTDS
jgi:biotin transporter BioY